MQVESSNVQVFFNILDMSDEILLKAILVTGRFSNMNLLLKTEHNFPIKA